MKITSALIKVYNKTVLNARARGKSEFLCSGLDCDECPFKNCECYKLSVRYGKALRTAVEWRNWFESLDKSEDYAADVEVVDEVNNSADDHVEKPAPIYNIARTTLNGEGDVIARKAISFEEVLTELDEFKKDLSEWVRQMQREACVISTLIPDYMEFQVVNVRTNCVIMDWATHSIDFGKKKVWAEA